MCGFQQRAGGLFTTYPKSSVFPQRLPENHGYKSQDVNNNLMYFTLPFTPRMPSRQLSSLWLGIPKPPKKWNPGVTRILGFFRIPIHTQNFPPRCSSESGQTTIIPKPELRGLLGDSLTKPPFKVTSAEVVIICPGESIPKVVFLSRLEETVLLFVCRSLAASLWQLGLGVKNVKGRNSLRDTGSSLRKTDLNSAKILTKLRPAKETNIIEKLLYWITHSPWQFDFDVSMFTSYFLAIRTLHVLCPTYGSNTSSSDSLLLPPTWGRLSIKTIRWFGTIVMLAGNNLLRWERPVRFGAHSHYKYLVAGSPKSQIWHVPKEIHTYLLHPISPIQYASVQISLC